MDIKFFKNRKDSIIFENKFLKISLLSLVATILLLLYALVFKIENQKIVILPPSLELKEFWIQGNQVSDSYLQMMADVISYNILNISDTQKRNNIDFVLAMVETEHIPSVRRELIEQANYLRDNSISQVFYITEYDVSNKGLILVKGLLKRYISEKQTDSLPYQLKIFYTIKRNKFNIVGLILSDEKNKKEGL